MIAEAALQEDVDVVGLPIFPCASSCWFLEVIQKLREVGKGDACLSLWAASFRKRAFLACCKQGVKKVYGPGTDTREVCQDIRAAMAERQQA